MSGVELTWADLEKLAEPEHGDCTHPRKQSRDCFRCKARIEMRRIRLIPIVQALEPWNEEINDKWAAHDSHRQAEDVLRSLHEAGLKVVPLSDQDVINGLRGFAADTV